jgi:late competence protein required for DNA uptake (superfamily II DNA/RNA helicase)
MIRWRVASSPTAAIGPRTGRRTTSSKGTIRLSMTGKPAAMLQALTPLQSVAAEAGAARVIEREAAATD